VTLADVTGEIVDSRDVGALAVPNEVAVPSTIDDAVVLLDRVGSLLWAGHWGTAAVVYAFTQEERQGRRTDLLKSEEVSCEEFADLGIRGLNSGNTVRKYRRAWQRAVDEGWTEPAKPGTPARLPVESFKLAAEAHVSNNSGNNEWYTPESYITAATSVMGGIDLDPASSEAANGVVGAAQFYDIDDDGLSATWAGRVWMNPPYAQPAIEHFCDKLVSEFTAGAVTEACVLVNNATETAWFQTLASQAAAICFPRGRVRFWQPDGTPGAPLQGQAVVYLGTQPDVFRVTFEPFGLVMP